LPNALRSSARPQIRSRATSHWAIDRKQRIEPFGSLCQSSVARENAALLKAMTAGYPFSPYDDHPL
jgi:hypothetical protein